MYDVTLLGPSVGALRAEATCGSSGSNRILERAIQSMIYQTKALKIGLEGKWGHAPPGEHPWRCCSTGV